MDLELQFVYQGRDMKVAIPEGEMVIGRKEICDLCLTEGGVSKLHARIMRRGPRYEVEDAGSRNGTLLNGQTITRAVMQAGDVLQVGVITMTIAERRGSIIAPSGRGFESLASVSGTGPAANSSRVSGVAAASRGGEGRDLDRDLDRDLGRDLGDDLIEGDEERVPSQPTARLRVFDGREIFDRDCYPDRVVTIGTKEGNIVELRGDGISRFHAEMYWDGQNWLIKDLGSRNGVYVKKPDAKEGVKADVHVLAAGDEIQIGTCRLRFEPLRVNNFELARALRDPRAKPVLAALVIVAAILLLPMGGGSAGGGAGGPLDFHKALNEGVQHIRESKTVAASEIFEKLQRQYPKENAPKLLLQVAQTWNDLKNPFAVDWDKTYDLIRKLQAEADKLPKAARLWVDTEAERIGLNRDGYKAFAEAENIRKNADKASGQSRLMAAIKTYDEALGLLRKISPKSAFAEVGEEQARNLERVLLDLHMNEGQRFYGSGNDEWNQALRFFEKAQTYTRDEGTLFKLRQLMNSCLRNHQDSLRYQEALEIVQGRNESRYPEAILLLREISSSSVIAKDAKAYMEWIEARLKVIEADQAYTRGNGDSAVRLLQQVQAVAALAPEVRRGVNQKMQRWKRVITAFNEGRAAYNEGEDGFRRARNLLTIVVKEETDASNYYRRRSIQMIDEMRVAVEGNDRNLAVRAVKALRAGSLANAIRDLEQLRRSKAGRPYLAKISRIVEEEARAKQWFHTAYWEVLLKRDLGRYAWAQDVFYLLKEYLPDENKARQEAARNYKRISDEIERIAASTRRSG